MKRLILMLLAVVVFGFGSWAAVPASATDYTACNGVWVVVDFGSLGGGVSTRCATSYSNGNAALRATFGATFSGGMVTAIAKKPANPDIYKDYWSYWHASRRSDGSYSGWSYSNLGAASYHPAKGSAEGWHYVSLSGSASPPGAKPPTNRAVVAKPKPKPKPTVTTSKPTASATASSKPTATVSASAKPTQTPTPTPTPAPTPTPTPAVAPPAPEGEDPGSPVALIATAATIGVGGLGAAAWWLKKGRQR